MKDLIKKYTELMEHYYNLCDTIKEDSCCDQKYLRYQDLGTLCHRIIQDLEKVYLVGDES